MVSDSSLRHQLTSENPSPIHQYYQNPQDQNTIPDYAKFSVIRDPTLGLPPENLVSGALGGYDRNSMHGGSPSQPFAQVFIFLT